MKKSLFFLILAFVIIAVIFIFSSENMLLQPLQQDNEFQKEEV